MKGICRDGSHRNFERGTERGGPETVVPPVRLRGRAPVENLREEVSWKL